MAICSKTIVEADKKKLTITQTFNTEPFPFATGNGVMKIRDEQGLLWRFEYTVKSKNKRVLSGCQWVQFVQNYGVQDGDMVAIGYIDGWCSEADYKIEVTKRGY
ncbi:hypothetical protein REPUB_Repub01dG0254200 [Reevesia pubescens]